MHWPEDKRGWRITQTNGEAADQRRSEAAEGASRHIAVLEARVAALGPVPAHTLEGEQGLDCSCGWRGTLWGGRADALSHVLDASGVLEAEKAQAAAKRAEADRIERERWEQDRRERQRDKDRARVRDSGHPYPSDVPPGGAYQCACGARVEVAAESNQWAAHAAHLDTLISAQ